MNVSTKTNNFWLSHFTTGIAGLLVCLVLLFLVGCSNNTLNDSTASIDQTNEAIDQGLTQVENLMPWVTASKCGAAFNPTSESKLVGEAQISFQTNHDNSADIALDFNGDIISFQFPKKCVPKANKLVDLGLIDNEKTFENLEITINGWKFETEDGYVYFYECLPHGLVFDKDVRMVHPVANLDMGEISVLFYGQDDGSYWEVEDVTTINGQHVATFLIEHFSLYGVSFP